MTLISRFGRVLTLLLCLLYIFTGSGLDKLTYQGISLISRSAGFPCQGHGCQCDKAGYELPNCQCDHQNNISCCSVDIPALTVEESCCSESPDLNCDSITNLPCQGLEGNEVNSLLKHLIFLPHFEKEEEIYLEIIHSPYIASIIEAEILTIDKVPIAS